jgi:hypothetical protein
MSKRYATAKPAIRAPQLARIRHAAQQYVLAGGSIFLDSEDAANRDEHIATLRTELHPKAQSTFEERLELILPLKTQYAQHEDLSSDVWSLVGAEGEAAYLFGLCVGFEIAALALGARVSTGGAVDRRQARKGSVR